MTEEEFADQLLRHEADGNGMEQAGDLQELQALQSALTSYRRDMTRWAERRSSAQPSLAQQARAQQRWAALPQWALAMVALVTIAGGAVHLLSDRAEDTGSSVAVTGVAADQTAATEDIAADNHLLSSIDAELSYHGGSPVDGLRLQERPTAEHVPVSGADD